MCKFFRYLESKYFAVFEVLDESGYWKSDDDAEFTQWMNSYIQDSKILDEEIAALDEDESLDKEQRRERFYKLMKEFGGKYRNRG